MLIRETMESVKTDNAFAESNTDGRIALIEKYYNYFSTLLYGKNRCDYSISDFEFIVHMARLDKTFAESDTDGRMTLIEKYFECINNLKPTEE